MENLYNTDIVNQLKEKNEQSNSYEVYDSILQTKLYASPPREGDIYRSRLINKLKLQSRHKLTLISAPAGYGKTTLVSEWLKDSVLPYTWLSLDSGDNEPLRFFTYLVAALRKIDANIGNKIQHLVWMSQSLSIELIVSSIISDIEVLDKDFILILDDYHVINNNLIHQAVQYLLNHQPNIMHLVILTREEPPLLLSRLRVREQLIRIDASDLCFNMEEAREFFINTMKLNISDEDIRLLESKTEGWIAGMQLAGLSLQGLNEAGAACFIKSFDGSNYYIVDYLVEEILYKQESNLSVFLYHTSCLGRFTASLCDAVMELKGSKQILEHLYKSNLFLIPLDDRGEWYRYHHLFADFLKSGLGSVEKQHIHLRASKWFEENGFITEAVEHAIASENTAEAERLIEKTSSEVLFSKAEFSTVLKWIDSLPEEQIYSNAAISVYKAWCYFLLGKLDAAMHFICHIENNKIIRDNSMWYGKLIIAKSAVLMLLGKSEALQYAKEGILYIEKTDSMFRIHALHAMGNSYLLIGNAREAVKCFKESLALAGKNNYYNQNIYAAFYLAIGMNLQGDLNEAKTLCEQIIAKYSKMNTEMIMIYYILYIPLGIMYYESNDLINASKYLRQGISIRNKIKFLHMYSEGDWQLALTLYSMGDVKAAINTIIAAKRTAECEKLEKLCSLIKAAEADINMLRGDMRSATKWMREKEHTLTEDIKPFLEKRYLSYVCLLIHKKQFDEARILLNNLEVSASEGERYGSLIRIHILQAAVCNFINDKAEALRYLRCAIEYAAYEGYYRCFIEYGHLILDILPAARNIAPEFLDELLKLLVKNDKEVQSQQDIGFLSYSTINLLTDRELEILKLISSGLSNKDIADKLFITVGTAKCHISNIYSKLGVSKRTQALAKAKKLGLI